MTQRSRPRRSHISGANGIREKARRIARERDHRGFTALLSGYDDEGRPRGPYSGARLLAGHERHVANDDDASLDHRGAFAKGVRHEALDETGRGLPEHAPFEAFTGALDEIRDEELNESVLADPINVERIDRLVNTAFAAGKIDPLVNPLAAIGTSLDGVDTMDVAIPPAPSLGSRHAASEMLELYWMSALRDTPFNQWDGNDHVEAAAGELDSWNKLTHDEEGTWFAEHSTSWGGVRVWDQTITPQRLFRGSAPGVDEGAYPSIFLHADVPFGTLDIAQGQFPLKDENRNYLVTPEEWHLVQQGERTKKSRAELEDRTAKKRPIATLRDLAHYVHFDALHEAYFNAALILDGAKAPTSVANIYNDIGVVQGPAGPVDRADIQAGFGTFGGPHIFVLLTEVATRALKAVWFQKWLVHRRLRPEVMGARLHCDRAHGTRFLHPDLGSTQGVAKGRAGPDCWLLPMVYEEGSPMHPSYGAGHATVAGACVTILKAMFNTQTRCSALKPNLGWPEGPKFDPSDTLEGELNKLAANIAIGRNAAGVHYRTDYTKSLALGEAVAAAVLQEKALTFADVDPARVFTFPTFDGHWVCIDATGKLSRCAEPGEHSDFAKDGEAIQMRDRSLFAG